MRRILICADDLGLSCGGNYGIAASVKSGIIRSIGLIPNMPDVQHGVELLYGQTYFFGY